MLCPPLNGRFVPISGIAANPALIFAMGRKCERSEALVSGGVLVCSPHRSAECANYQSLGAGNGAALLRIDGASPI